MSLKTFVKVSNITNLSDARYCAGMGVDVLGFPVDEQSPSHISPESFEEITEWISGPRLAGEFGKTTLEDIKLALRSYQLDIIEITQVDLVEPVALLGKPVFMKLDISTPKAFDLLKSRLSYLDELVEAVTLTNPDGKMAEDLKHFMSFYNGNVKLLRGFGLPAAEQEEYLMGPGLTLEATEEDRPGYKDYGQVMDILEAIEAD